MDYVLDLANSSHCDSCVQILSDAHGKDYQKQFLVKAATTLDHGWTTPHRCPQGLAFLAFKEVLKQP